MTGVVDAPHLQLNEQVARLECLSFRESPDGEPQSAASAKDICPFCVEEFHLDDDKQVFLTHLLTVHKLVISDVEEIADFRRYIYYWRDRLLCKSIEEFCTIIHTNTRPSDCGESERYYFLCDALPEDKALRKKLHKYKLEQLLKQQEKERSSPELLSCLFCKYNNTRNEIFAHMLEHHSFSVGLPDNLVYAGKFLSLLQEKLTSLKCLYCEKTFTSRPVLKEHMRKKLHKRINESNKEYDKFYICNYLEFGKKQDKNGKDGKKISEKTKNEETSSESMLKDSEKDEGWSEWVGITQNIHCLFCQRKYPTMNAVHDHMKHVHFFDFNFLKKDLDFYSQIKLVNFIRKKNHDFTCYTCNAKGMTSLDLNAHYEATLHCTTIPDRKVWDQPIYYFPTFEDDAFLCSLQE